MRPLLLRGDIRLFCVDDCKLHPSMPAENVKKTVTYRTSFLPRDRHKSELARWTGHTGGKLSGPSILGFALVYIPTMKSCYRVTWVGVNSKDMSMNDHSISSDSWIVHHQTMTLKFE